MKVAIGYDRHELIPSERGRVTLAGVAVECGCAVRAHSDGDVVLHSIADAILSVFLHSDIGRVFGEDRDEYRGCASSVFVSEAFAMAGRPRVANVDAIVICDVPKVAPYVDEMRAIIARLLDIDEDLVSIRGRHREGAQAEMAVECFVSILFA